MASTYDEVLKRLYANMAQAKPTPVAPAAGLMAQRPGIRTPAMQQDIMPGSSIDYVTDFVTKIAASTANKNMPQTTQPIDPLTTTITDLYDGYNTALYNFYKLNEGTETPQVEDNEYRDTALRYLNKWLTSEDEPEVIAPVEEKAPVYEEPFFSKPTRKVIDETATTDAVDLDGMQPAGKEFSFESTSRRLVDDLKRDFDLNDMQAAALVGNLAVETDNFNTLQEYKPVVEGSKGGYGFAQWTGDRRAAYEKWAADNDLDPASYEANYGYLKYELSNRDDIIQNMGRNTIRDLREAKDKDEATRIVMDGYLRPGVPHLDKRKKATQSVLDLLQ